MPTINQLPTDNSQEIAKFQISSERPALRAMRIFDSHFHIINPAYPLVPNHGYLPPEFTVEAYRAKLEDLTLAGGVVVSGSFQAFDQEYLIDALNKLGRGYYGVANIPVDCPTELLERLNAAGVTAVRFNLVRGGSTSAEHLDYLSQKLYREFGWHTELYLDSIDIPDLWPVLKQLPAYSIDHLGLSQSGLAELYKLVESGARVKASGFGRLDFHPVPVMKKIMQINPEALMFGTDLPSTRAKVPFTINDVNLIQQEFSSELTDMIMYRNAFNWYNK